MNKHIDGNVANATGACNGHIYGFAEPSGDAGISGAVSKVVKNGEVVEVSIPRQGRHQLTIAVIPKN